jgi:sec-independent protein translocase protein TatA
MEGLSPLHLIVVLVIAVLVLGPGKLPEVGAALGKTLREFRKATTEVQDAVRLDSASPPAPAALQTVAPVLAAAPPLAALEPDTQAGPSGTAPTPATRTGIP